MHTLSRIYRETTTGRAPQSCSGVNQTPPCGSGSNFSAYVEGYDGGSSESECESPILDEQECQSPLMPEFWLIVKIHQDRVKVYSHSRSGIPQKILLEHSSLSHGATEGSGGCVRLLFLDSIFVDNFYIFKTVIVASVQKRLNVHIY